MPIKNMTRNKVIATYSKLADSTMARTMGLMFSKPTQAALILKFEEEKKISLHMFFVFYAIDVLFVNKRKKIVEMKENFKPFKTFVAGKKAKYAIELPAGTIKQTKTKVGDKIEFLTIKKRNYSEGRSITITRSGK